eukprot:GSChrysophyteH1.ASY1.ANO1.964.1 assembled CDS
MSSRNGSSVKYALIGLGSVAVGLVLYQLLSQGDDLPSGSDEDAKNEDDTSSASARDPAEISPTPIVHPFKQPDVEEMHLHLGMSDEETDPDPETETKTGTETETDSRGPDSPSKDREMSEEAEKDFGMRQFNSPSKVYDCVVVGAGIAGLSTATELITKHGISRDNILILEAQPYIGGRIRQVSDFIPGIHVDVGAEIVHGTRTALNDILEKTSHPWAKTFVWAQGDGGPLEKHVEGTYGLYYVKATGKNGKSNPHVLRYDSGDKQFIRINTLLEGIPEMKEDTSDIDKDLSLYDYLEKNGTSHETAIMGLAEAGWSNTLCSNLKDLSLQGVVDWTREWAQEAGEEVDLKVPDSFKVFVRYYLAQLGHSTELYLSDKRSAEGSKVEEKVPVDIQTSCCVDTVDTSGVSSGQPVTLSVRCKLSGTAEGDCSDSSWGCSQNILARAVVITAPLKVLQAGRIQFTPPLPALQIQALAARNMRPAMKVILKFQKRCWPEGLAGMIMAGAGNGIPKEGRPDGRTDSDDKHDDECLIPEIWFNDLTKHPRFIAGHVQEDIAGYCTAFLTAEYATRLRAYAAQRVKAKDNATDVNDIMFASVLQQLEEVFSHLHPQDLLPQGKPTLAPKMVHIDGPNGTKKSLNMQKKHLQQEIKNLPKPSEAFMVGMVYIWDERSHPFIGGGYSSPKAGFYETHLQSALTQVISDEHCSPNPGLFFAGEGASPGAGATAHTAIETGIKAALQVQNRLTVC